MRGAASRLHGYCTDRRTGAGPGRGPPRPADHPGPRLLQQAPSLCKNPRSFSPAMHFASRLGLDQQSARGIPAARDDDRPALLREIAALKLRVAELETALRQSQSQSHAVSVSRPAKNKTAPIDTTAKPKDQPWIAAGVSKATYYRKLKASNNA